jgi:hypothetical protein
MNVRSAARRHLVFGVFGLCLSVWGLWQDIGWIAQPFYAYAWWTYIFLLDGFVALRRGDSLLTTRRRFIGPIVLWSVTFWFFFELLNIRFQNWYYIGVFDVRAGPEVILGVVVFDVACFGTVFTGLFQTYEAIAALGLFRGRSIRPRRLASAASYVIQGLGAVMVALAVLFPFYLAPLVWGSLTFLVDPWNYRRGARSLLGDVERGDVGIVARLLLAGLVCGLVWESFNFLAPQKWIYTVLGLEDLKLFEMPALGFLGFPSLALDAFAADAMIAYRFHGNEAWENPSDIPVEPRPRRPVSPTLFWGLTPLHVAFWGLVIVVIQEVNIGSVQLEFQHLEGLPARAVVRLEEQGIRRPRQLLRALDDPTRREQIESSLGMGKDAIEDLIEEVRLFTLKGIGHDHGRLLQRVGIHTVADLDGQDPNTLYARLVEVRQAQTFPALALVA